MKFTIQHNEGEIVIPGTILEICDLDGLALECHAQSNLLAMIPAQMDAMMVIQTLCALHSIEARLVETLMNECKGEDCGENPLCENLKGNLSLEIPDWARKAAGLEEDCKLDCYVSEGANCVIVKKAPYNFDIADVPQYLQEALIEAGVCLRELDEHLMEEDIIYGK